jgi:hypothetical protein
MADVSRPGAKSGERVSDRQDEKVSDDTEKPAEHKSEDVWYVVGFAGGNVTSYGEYDNKRDAEESASVVVGGLVIPSTRKVVEE